MPLYSEEIQDIMGKIPGRILKIGLTIIFIIMLMLLLGSYFFKYPEIVSCPVVLTTVNPPLELYVKSPGKIDRLFVKEHEKVEQGQIIAVLENTANFEDILKLKTELSLFDEIVIWDSVVLQAIPDEYLSLGEIQNNYIRFFKGRLKFHYYLKQNHLPLKIQLLEKQIQKQQKIYKTFQQQEMLQKLDFQLTVKQFVRDSLFFCKYKDAVSLAEYEKNSQSFLQKKSSYINFCSSVSEAENSILKLCENKIDLEIQYVQELNSYRMELDESYRLLKEAYNQWKEKYLIETTICGLVTFTGYWSENQMIQIGDRLATIVPVEKKEIIGRAVIDMAGIGKVEKGQRVNIKLQGFPYMEYGLLKGVVNNISLVPEKGKGYIAEIRLTDGMRSSYRERLDFIQQMEGIAEIVTKDKRLISRLINPLKFKINE